MNKPIPQSKAKTAWGLLGDVKRAMLAEPKRVNMGVWIAKSADYAEYPQPACGTIGCLAGWVSLLKGGCPSQHLMSVSEHAQELIGAADYYTAPDDDGKPGYHIFNCDGPDLKGHIGTATYAKSIMRRIDRFMKVNAKALKAKRV